MPTAIIWGSEGEIGKALARKAISKGWGIVGVSRDRAASAGGFEIEAEADFAQQAEVDRALLAISQEVNEIDMVVYAAGDIQSTKIEGQGEDDWHRIIESNLGGAIRCVTASLPLIRDDGNILVIGAKSERLQLPGLSAYAASKAGLEAWMEVLRKEQRNRRVLLIRPAAVKTSFWEKVPFNAPANALETDEFAGMVWRAVEDGQTGVLDLD
jgi:NAD(P)-dependent dehydrogenase (short-subunit alcohol dehydrogenase family)